MLFDIHSDLFMDVDNRRVAGSRNAIAENHSERLKAGGVTSMLAPLFINPYKKDVMHQKARSMFKSMCAELNDHKDSVVVAKCAQDFTDAEQQGKLALMLGSEGLCYIGEEISLIEVFYQLGMREVSLTWNEDNCRRRKRGFEPWPNGDGEGTGEAHRGAWDDTRCFAHQREEFLGYCKNCA